MGIFLDSQQLMMQKWNIYQIISPPVSTPGIYLPPPSPVGIWWCTTITDPSLFKFHLTPASNEWMSGARKEGSFYNAVLVPSSSEKRKYFHGEGEVNSEEEQRRRTEEYECRKWRRKLKLQYFKRRNIVMESIPGKIHLQTFLPSPNGWERWSSGNGLNVVA